MYANTNSPIKTTEIAVLRTKPLRFTWGEIIKIHDIGQYSVIEYRAHGSGVEFYPYVNDKPLNHFTNTLDGAILLAIAAANLPGAEAATMARGAVRLLGVKDA